MSILSRAVSGLVLAMSLCSAGFAAHLNSKAMGFFDLTLSETSGSAVASYLMEQAGVENPEVRNRYVHYLMHPRDPEAVQWVTSGGGGAAAGEMELVVSRHVARVNGLQGMPARRVSSFFARQLDGLLFGNQFSGNFPVAELAPEYAKFLPGFRGPLSEADFQELRTRIYKTFAQETPLTAPASREDSLLLMIYTHQTGDVELLKKVWRRGTASERLLVLTLLELAEDSQALVNLGLRCVADVAQSTSTAIGEPPLAALFLLAQKEDPEAGRLAAHLLMNGPGNLYRQVPELAQVVEVTDLSDDPALQEQVRRTRDRFFHVSQVLDRALGDDKGTTSPLTH